MARTKKETATPSTNAAPVQPSIFWKGETIGDTVKGKFVSWQMTTLGNLAMKLETANGEKLVGMTTVLFNIFTTNRNIKPGTVVEIIYEGQVKRAKLYSAIVGGKKLSSSMSFPAASQEEVNAVFDAGYSFKKRGKGK